ncbi:hypothetical protein AVEN_39829-1, partial [Araneus ventricosus]
MQSTPFDFKRYLAVPVRGTQNEASVPITLNSNISRLQIIARCPFSRFTQFESKGSCISCTEGGHPSRITQPFEWFIIQPLDGSIIRAAFNKSFAATTIRTLISLDGKYSTLYGFCVVDSEEM